MIHRSAHNGQPQSHRQAAFEAVRLHWDVPLVVVHGHHRVEFPSDGPEENGVGWVWASGVNPPGLCRLHCRCDLFYLLAAQQTAFPAVGIECSHTQTRFLDTHRWQTLGGELDGPQHALPGDSVRYLAQGDVTSDVHDSQ